MTSLEVKTEMMKHNVKQWQLAEAVGVSAMTLTRWLRNEELDDGTSEVLMNAINDIGSDNCKDVQLVSRNGNRSLLLVNLENIDHELSEIGVELERIADALEIIAMAKIARMPGGWTPYDKMEQKYVSQIVNRWGIKKEEEA